jgi:hypothetical protein
MAHAGLHRSAPIKPGQSRKGHNLAYRLNSQLLCTVCLPLRRSDITMATMDIDRIISELSLNEKVSLLSGPSYLPGLLCAEQAPLTLHSKVPTPGTPLRSQDSAYQQFAQQTVQTAHAGPATSTASPPPASHAGQD